MSFCRYCGSGTDTSPKEHTMDCDRPFKVMRLIGREYPETQIASIPFSFLTPHEAQALKNHNQDLATLNQRGGLSPLEIYAVVKHLSYRTAVNQLTESSALQWLLQSINSL